MKANIQYDEHVHPPVLRMYIHGCPHKRQITPVLQRFREDLFEAAQRQIGEYVDFPIKHDIDLAVTLVNPASPDLDHLMEAIFMAMDGKNGSLKGQSILEDDRQIQSFSVRKFYPNPATKRDNCNR